MAADSASRVKRALRPVLALVALLFVVHTAYGLAVRWDGSSVTVHWGWVTAALLPAVLAMLAQLFAWRALIKGWTNHDMPARASAKLYVDSQMARYTPGKVALPVVRMAGAQAVGVAPKVMGTALLAELLSWCGTGSLVGGVALGLMPNSSGVAQELSAGSLVFGAGAGVSVVAFVMVDTRRFPLVVRRLLGDEQRGPLLPWKVPIWHLAHFLMWIVCGMFVCRAVGGTWETGVLAGALLCLALIAGFVAFLAPAGAGVREAILAAGMAPALGASAGVALGILARVVSLLADVVLWVWFRARASAQAPGR